MKRLLIMAGVAAVVVGVFLLGIQTLKVLDARRETSALRSVLPDADLVDADGLPTRIPSGSAGGTVVVFFTTTCEYCRAEIAAMTRHAKAFGDADVVLISPEDRRRLDALNREFQLDGLPRFWVLRDTIPGLGRRLRIRLVPTVLVYDSGGRLQHEFEGWTPVETILRTMKGAP
ncbi:MAG: TlpA disulfide reductase family protein [Rhodothermales bacterium]